MARIERRRVSFVECLVHFLSPLSTQDRMMLYEANHYCDGAVTAGGVLCNSLFHTAQQMSTLQGELCSAIRRPPATHCQTVHFSFSLPGW